MRTANTRTIAHAIAAMLLLASCSAPQYADGREKEMLRRNATLSNQLMGLADLAGALWRRDAPSSRSPRSRDCMPASPA
jgi:hypothetical protein